jgi:hypothetical protein
MKLRNLNVDVCQGFAKHFLWLLELRDCKPQERFAHQRKAAENGENDHLIVAIRESADARTPPRYRK